MTLNKFLASQGIKVSKKHRHYIGANFSHCARAIKLELSKKEIKEGGKRIMVNNYPIEFLKQHGEKLLNRYLIRHNLRKNSGKGSR